jgi:hypothetical protein
MKPDAWRYDVRDGLALTRVLPAYEEWVLRRVSDGDLPCLLTFEFGQLPGNRWAVLAQMRDEIVRCYATFLRRAFHHPARLSAESLPLWLCSPDLPVWKRDAKFRSARGNAVPNGGIHYHALGLFPPRNRLRDGIEQHFTNKQILYASPGTRLTSLYVKPSPLTPDQATDYAIKSIKKHRFDYDHMLILPRLRREIAA